MTPSKKTSPGASVRSANSEVGDVEELLRTLDHPRKAEIQAVRALILGASSRIAEGVKWKAPSFRVDEYFATFNLRAREGVQVIFHQGAKVTAGATEGIPVDDPGGLLRWLAKDRASVTFVDAEDIAARSELFQELVRRWIALLP